MSESKLFDVDSVVPIHLDADNMPEVFRPSAEHRLTHDDSTSAESELRVTSPIDDEFVIGFRDCANESLRYLAATTAVASADITADAQTSRYSLFLIFLTN